MLLQRVFDELDLRGGSLVPVSAIPSSDSDPCVWGELGDWLLLADRVGAEHVFFVHDDPVLVFSSLPSTATEDEVMELYRRAWSMARPRCLFVEVHDELRVYNLSEPPVAPGEPDRTVSPLEVIDRVTNVRTTLQRFHRDRFESGAAFEDPALARSAGRADRRLLDDVRAATAALIGSALAPQHAHALIERAILVRYLEDRGVLTERYFDDLLSNAATRPDMRGPQDLGHPSRFIEFLSDKQLTYALFDQLAIDFNGDLFVPDPIEREVVADTHLRLLGELLSGTASAVQEPLFLWAYDFSVVPTGLISSMYELFYRQEVEGKPDSTYYTSADLVEFVLADVLRPEVLDKQPIICDPACGSGIFLVEAYRRIVRHETARREAPLTTDELRNLLLGRLAGCDIDRSAVRLAAFSLYVAFLNYQTPQDIRSARPLPPLIARPDDASPSEPLHVADAFSSLNGGELTRGLAGLPWSAGSFDVIVGNPPWTEPRKGPKSLAETWAERRGHAVGHRSPSQLFLWRALDLLADSGVASMLVSAKVFFNVGSRTFREQWLSQARLQRVINFSEVRRDFFERAIAPFALVRFAHAGEQPLGPLIYETARRVPKGRKGAPALARLDRRIVDQRALITRDVRWKTYSAGDQRDDALVNRLELEGRLSDLLSGGLRPQYGYQRARPEERDAREPTAEWTNLPSLAAFTSWGPLSAEKFEELPAHVKFSPPPALFTGLRLLVRRPVASGFGPHARLVSSPLAFRHTTYAIPMARVPPWQADIALGTLLSSLGRYWLYMVSGSWGTWSDEVYAEQLLDLPLRLRAGHPANERISAAVGLLPGATDARQQKLGGPPMADVGPILGVINDAVAELFELSEVERDLVEDFWFSMRRDGSMAISGPQPQMTMAANAEGDLARYVDVFKRSWRPILGSSAELDAHVWRDARSQIIAAAFETRAPDDPPPSVEDACAAWSEVLDRYELATDNASVGGLLSYGVVRAVSDHAIVVVKRNERRLWSATAARDDAEATAAQAMALQRA